MTTIKYTSELFREGNCYVGLCRELDLSSFGDSPDEARRALQEAVEAFVEGCEHLGTLVEVLDESGFELVDGVWKLRDRVTADEIAVVA